MELNEEDGSQKVINPDTSQVFKLGKRERAAQKVISWQHITREATLAERAHRLHAIRADDQYHHNYGWPILGAHLAFWSI